MHIETPYLGTWVQNLTKSPANTSLGIIQEPIVSDIYYKMQIVGKSKR